MMNKNCRDFNRRCNVDIVVELYVVEHWLHVYNYIDSVMFPLPRKYYLVKYMYSVIVEDYFMENHMLLYTV